MLELHKRDPQTPQEANRIQREIAATDTAIDKLVYELYGLTEEEVRIVEGGASWKFKVDRWKGKVVLIHCNWGATIDTNLRNYHERLNKQNCNAPCIHYNYRLEKSWFIEVIRLVTNGAGDYCNCFFIFLLV